MYPGGERGLGVGSLLAAGAAPVEFGEFWGCSRRTSSYIYLVVCRCFPYFGGVVSVCVYFAVIDRSGQEESAKLAEESRAVASVPL